MNPTASDGKEPFSRRLSTPARRPLAAKGNGRGILVAKTLFFARKRPDKLVDAGVIHNGYSYWVETVVFRFANVKPVFLKGF